MVIGQNSEKQGGDYRIAFMAVQSDVAARQRDRPAEAQPVHSSVQSATQKIHCRGRMTFGRNLSFRILTGGKMYLALFLFGGSAVLRECAERDSNSLLAGLNSRLGRYGNLLSIR